MAGGVALGIALLALGGLALLTVPIVLLHQYYLRAASAPLSQGIAGEQSWLSCMRKPGLLHGIVALAAAAVIFLPWFIAMVKLHGHLAVAALEVPPDGLVADRRLNLLPRLIELAPATLPLALYGAMRAIRSALRDEGNSRETVGGSLWVIWLATAALTPAVWPNAPRGELELILLVPLCLLAAQTIADIINRRVPVRALVVLAPATAVTIAWWASANLHTALDELFHGRANTMTALGLHLALDLAVACI